MAGQHFATALYRLRWRLRTFLSGYPSIYLPLARRRHPLLVTARTELVFEGFFRSGNTFAFEAFRMAQLRSVRVARHIHAPAQVLFAAQRDIPVLLAVRDPDSCIPSLLLFEPRITPANALQSYIVYHQRLLSVLDRCVVASFQQITTDFSAVCRRINRKYSTAFAVFEHSEANVAACFARMQHLTQAHFGTVLEDKTCRPSAHRNGRKIDLAQHAAASPRLRRLLQQAREAYASCRPFC